MCRRCVPCSLPPRRPTLAPASTYAQDICIGDSVIKQTADAYRKLRNTARYMLGNLHDYDPEQHAVPYEELPELDRYMLGRLAEVGAGGSNPNPDPGPGPNPNPEAEA